MYIQRHRELFEGHMKKVGNFKYLDYEAIKILEKQYPMPKESDKINIIENTNIQQKYMDALEKINYLQDKISILEKSLQTKLLEEKEIQDTRKLNDEIILLKEKYENLKNRSLWDIIFHRS